MFLDILECRIENKTKKLGKTVLSPELHSAPCQTEESVETKQTNIGNCRVETIGNNRTSCRVSGRKEDCSLVDKCRDLQEG